MRGLAQPLLLVVGIATVTAVYETLREARCLAAWAGTSLTLTVMQPRKLGDPVAG